jgi:hypothetical protein
MLSLVLTPLARYLETHARADFRVENHMSE